MSTTNTGISSSLSSDPVWLIVVLSGKVYRFQTSWDDPTLPRIDKTADPVVAYAQITVEEFRDLSLEELAAKYLPYFSSNKETLPNAVADHDYRTLFIHVCDFMRVNNQTADTCLQILKQVYDTRETGDPKLCFSKVVADVYTLAALSGQRVRDVMKDILNKRYALVLSSRKKK